MQRALSGGLAVVALLVGVACGARPPDKLILVEESGGTQPLDDALRATVPPPPVDVTFQQTLQLFGVRLPTTVRAGDVIEGTLWWLVQHEPGGRRPRVLVRARVQGADDDDTKNDHALPQPVAQWQLGDVLVDRIRVAVPASASGDVVVSVGVAEGDWRWRARVARGGPARRDLVDVGVVHVVDARPPALARVPRAHGVVTVDGVLDEPDWGRAAVLSLSSSSGRGVITRPTTALLLWSPDALFLAFRAVDPDPFSPYTADDDPLYESEALEIFLDADGDADEYVELQAAPTDRRFDASFVGGRRRGMDVSYSAGHVVKTKTGDVDGRAGFVQEWHIPTAHLRDVPAGEPRAGARWRANLFRLERLRAGPGASVTKTEGSAWSPPLGGDFHNLARMGTLEFVDDVDAEPSPSTGR